MATMGFFLLSWCGRLITLTCALHIHLRTTHKLSWHWEYIAILAAGVFAKCWHVCVGLERGVSEQFQKNCVLGLVNCSVKAGGSVPVAH